jgi:hypothetical protein
MSPLRRLLLPVLLAALGLVLVAPAQAAPETRLTTTLSWQQEVGTGSDHGFGWASVVISGDSVCFGVRWTNLDEVLMAHVHVGDEGVPGPIVVPLFVEGPGPNSSDSSAWGCVRGQDEAVLQAIAAGSEHYYVNVHTAQFPSGAVRGQL